MKITKLNKDGLWGIHDPKGIGGVVRSKYRPKLRKQDKEFEAIDLYAVVFFPRLDHLGPATPYFHDLNNKLAQTPEAAIAKFMDGMAPGQNWEDYKRAGHKVRKIRISDGGPARVRKNGWQKIWRR